MHIVEKAQGMMKQPRETLWSRHTCCACCGESMKHVEAAQTWEVHGGRWKTEADTVGAAGRL